MRSAVELTELDRLLARTIFGNDDPFAALGRLVDAEECFFVACSQGMVFGLRLGDGSRVALKALRPRDGLALSRAVQRALHDRGFPCPRPLLGPSPLGAGVAFVDEWVDAEQRDMHEPGRRRVAARLLGELIELAPRIEGLPRTLAPSADSPFPRPHSPRFDFTRPEGAWIDRAAARALAIRDAATAPAVVGHSDWSGKHFGWRDGRIRAVYDWPDSVAADAEATLVGQASLVFPSTWDLPIEPKLAPPDEADAFVEEYEEAARRRVDRELVAAARLYLLAYCARCELSDLRGGQGEFQEQLRAALD